MSLSRESGNALLLASESCWCDPDVFDGFESFWYDTVSQARLVCLLPFLYGALVPFRLATRIWALGVRITTWVVIIFRPFCGQSCKLWFFRKTKRIIHLYWYFQLRLSTTEFVISWLMYFLNKMPYACCLSKEKSHRSVPTGLINLYWEARQHWEGCAEQR